MEKVWNVLGDMQLEWEGLIYIHYVPQKEVGEHRRIGNNEDPKGLELRLFLNWLRI